MSSEGSREGKNLATVLPDDHLLRDWLTGPDVALRKRVARSSLATTNLLYARFCKSAAKHGGGALLGSWSEAERTVVIGGLISLPAKITIVPMQALAWRMGLLASTHTGLSTLGAEAIAAAETLRARIVVSSRDDGPGIRAACATLGIAYKPLFSLKSAVLHDD